MSARETAATILDAGATILGAAAPLIPGGWGLLGLVLAAGLEAGAKGLSGPDGGVAAITRVSSSRDLLRAALREHRAKHGPDDLYDQAAVEYAAGDDS